MTDKELQKLMDDTYKACIHHKKLLDELEEEYEKRYGYDPSSVDDDYFIDTFHYGSGGRITVKQMAKNARLHS